MMGRNNKLHFFEGLDDSRLVPYMADVEVLRLVDVYWVKIVAISFDNWLIDSNL